MLRRKPKLCTAATVFDCWVMNEDRHRNNVLYAPQLDVPFTLIDFESGLLAGGRDVTKALYLDDHMVSGPVAEAVTSWEHVADWIEQLQAVPAGAIERICKEAASGGAVRSEKVDQSVEALVYRQAKLGQLMTAGDEDGKMSLTGARRLLP